MVLVAWVMAVRVMAAGRGQAAAALAAIAAAGRGQAAAALKPLSPPMASVTWAAGAPPRLAVPPRVAVPPLPGALLDSWKWWLFMYYYVISEAHCMKVSAPPSAASASRQKREITNFPPHISSVMSGITAGRRVGCRPARL